jgi:Bacterial Ig-like domain
MIRTALLACTLVLAAPSLALGAVSVGQPFPSDRLTVIDKTQLTGLRVALPKPDCAALPSDCADIDVLNTLDGFNVDARVSIPFSGAIDLATVTPDTVFLTDRKGNRVALDRLVWTAATNTLHGHPAVYLDQDTTYLLAVTDGVRAADGNELAATDFREQADDDYGRDLFRALPWTRLPKHRLVAASLFTTQSITSILEQVRRSIDQSRPEPVRFDLGPAGKRTVFPFDAVASVTFNRQVGTSTFAPTVQPAAVTVVPGAIGTVAYGTYASPDYENAQKVIPPAPTRKLAPVPVQGTSQIYVNVYLPNRPEPPQGFPVAIFGHGFTDSKQGAPLAVASLLANSGIATVAINVVGHGGGPLGTLTVARTDGVSVTFPAGGRGFDQNGNGTIDSTEGVSAAPPFTVVGNRDGLRQTVVDLMQLVREIEVGVDVDGDGRRDLDRDRVYYFGQSFGGIYGTTFLAVEPDVHAGVVNVPGGSISEIARLSPSFRPLVGLALIGRTPSLYNAVPNPTFTNFVESMPLSGLPPLVDAVPGADAIQRQLDWNVWAQAAADPVAYARHLRADPLANVDPKRVIVQFAKGDQTVPNPTATALIKAGALADRTLYFRNDLAFASVPGYTVRNPHTFLTNLAGVPGQFAISAQQQIVTFFGTNGLLTVDPDAAGPFFEAPIAGPLPEGLNFLP